MKQSDFIFFVLRFWDYAPPYIIEKHAVSAFLNENFLRAIRIKIKQLEPPERGEPHSCALEKYSDKSFTRKEVLPQNPSNRIAIEYWVQYIPEVTNFPLVDAFFLCEVTEEDAVWAADDYGGWAPHDNQHFEAVH
ncbi:putative retrotransposon hot spot (RHS) protein [Trypanosoma cruzi]|nr:putative retrotransposon hot spot (RHS) protein [Trypanosoma cruzi]